MFIKRKDGPVAVRLEDGSILTLSDLPPPDISRWVASRKATVARAVRAGLLSAREACERWELSEEELEGWIRAYERHGSAALRATAIKQYRGRGSNPQ